MDPWIQYKEVYCAPGNVCGSREPAAYVLLLTSCPSLPQDSPWFEVIVEKGFQPLFFAYIAVALHKVFVCQLKSWQGLRNINSFTAHWTERLERERERRSRITDAKVISQGPTGESRLSLIKSAQDGFTHICSALEDCFAITEQWIHQL